MDTILTYIEGPFGALVMLGAAQLANLTIFVATLWMTVVAARKSITWGLFVLFIPMIGPICFARRNWIDAKNPFLLYMLGCLFLVLSICIFVLRSIIATFFNAAP